MKDKSQLAEELNEYASRHRMMFGLTPEWNLFIEIIKCLQAQEAEKSDVVVAKKKTPPTVRTVKAPKGTKV